jgi:hypothetical protein
MSLPPLPKVQKLQETLHAKAKGSPTFRFYALYDKVSRAEVLWVAYRRCLSNGGAAGVDGQTFADIEAYGVTKWLGDLAEALGMKTYRPSPVRRVYLLKPDGKQRPLGIPMAYAYCISLPRCLGIAVAAPTSTNSLYQLTQYSRLAVADQVHS